MKVGAYIGLLGILFFGDERVKIGATRFILCKLTDGMSGKTRVFELLPILN